MAPVEAVILAGGLGTRLRSAVPDLPKVLAPVAERPFLSYVLTYLSQQGIEKLIFALGYKAEVVQAWLMQNKWPFTINITIEATPLGTGGAIRNAWRLTTADDVLVLNGDTFCPAAIDSFYEAHQQQKADISLVSVHLSPAYRYGSLHISPEGWLLAFHEKEPRLSGWISAGLYLIRRSWWETQSFPHTFSWESYLEEALASSNPPRIYVHQMTDLPFIDIGVPEDYERAQTYLPAHF